MTFVPAFIADCNSTLIVEYDRNWKRYIRREVGRGVKEFIKFEYVPKPDWEYELVGLVGEALFEHFPEFNVPAHQERSAEGDDRQTGQGG